MTLLCLLPAIDHDPTESAVLWHALTTAGIDVQFATPAGEPGYADARLVSEGFGVLNPFLMTRAADLALYHAMSTTPAFLAPQPYVQVDTTHYEGLFIPGGHAAGVRSLLESPVAQAICLGFFRTDKPVAAVCHGVLLPARTMDPTTGRSVLHGRKTTALTASMELSAWLITKPWLGDYYRTYPQTVEAEVKAALAQADDFSAGPLLPLRDTADELSPGFAVVDGQYFSARWPGDCHQLASLFTRHILAHR
ncbi:type 1 glutamine amidotransferase family protein [Chitinimonas naiadis]